MSGTASLGSVNVPTPYFYIPANKDEHHVLDKLGKWKGIASFFYHPYLEFPFLDPVLSQDGSPMIRDGIPVYAYRSSERSTLQKLIAGVKAKNYEWYSVHDYIPFTPSASYPLPRSRERVVVNKPANGTKQQELDKQNEPPMPQLGDVTGDGQADIVSWDVITGDLNVVPGSFQGLRNDEQQQAQRWLNISYSEGAVYALADANQDGKLDIWVVRASGRLEQYESTGTSFILKKSWKFPKVALRELYVLKQSKDNWVIAGLSSDYTRLISVSLHNGDVKPMKEYEFQSDSRKRLLIQSEEATGKQSLVLTKSGSSSYLQYEVDLERAEWESSKVLTDVAVQSGALYLGDFNGDGHTDLLRYDSRQRIYSVYLQTGDKEYRFLSTFGPWGEAGGSLRIVDLDGNGKSDLALVDEQGTIMDTALSFETKN
ncbi:FG-GAP repeat protein [compost metagenome]